MKPDAALELVEAYLRVNGYFVLTELELHVKDSGGYRTFTDVDIIALRLPTRVGPAHYHATGGTVECLLADEVDPALGVGIDRCDVIIGEVKRGAALFNRALLDPTVLHAVLRRIGDAAQRPLNEIVDQLVEFGEATTPAAQVRLVAFGRDGTVSHGIAIHHRHMVEWLNQVVERHRDLFEITIFSDPVLSLLALASRIGQPLAGGSNRHVADVNQSETAPNRPSELPGQ